MRPLLIYFINVFTLIQSQIAFGQNDKRNQDDKQYCLRLVNEIALKAIEVRDDKLAGLLALQAYKYNVRYEGYSMNAWVHLALSTYLEKAGELPMTILASDTSKHQPEDRKLLSDIKHLGLKTVLSNHFPEVEYLKFSHSKKLLAAKCEDNGIYVWDLTKINESPIRIIQKNKVSEFLFSSDEKQVICLTEDSNRKKTFRGWPLSLDLLAKMICNGIKQNLTLEQWRIYIGDDMPYEATCN